MKFRRQKQPKVEANALEGLMRARAQLAAVNPEVLVSLATDEGKRKLLLETRDRMAAMLVEHQQVVAQFTDMVERLDRALQSAVEA